MNLVLHQIHRSVAGRWQVSASGDFNTDGIGSAIARNRDRLPDYGFLTRNHTMANTTTVAVLRSHEKAEEAIRDLQKAGFDMQKQSIIGKDYHTEEHAVGYYNAGDRMLCWGQLGAFWGGMWGMLFGSAFFLLPGIGPVLVAGPLVAWIVAGLEGAIVLGGFSALGAALASVGIPENSIVQYESELKVGKFLVIVHGTQNEVERARIRLGNTELMTDAAPPVMLA